MLLLRFSTALRILAFRDLLQLPVQLLITFRTFQNSVAVNIIFFRQSVDDCLQVIKYNTVLSFRLSVLNQMVVETPVRCFHNFKYSLLIISHISIQ